jgi:hypothetical protein
MINLLIINNNLHHKNKDGLIRILEYINKNTPIRIIYKWGTVNDIPNNDIIYSPFNPINTALYPASKKFIFGPHFSVFPDDKLKQINNINNNCIYIQPSIPAMEVWQSAINNLPLPITWFPFPVNTDKFKPLNPHIPSGNNPSNPLNIFIYYKRRHPHEFSTLLNLINSQSEKNPSTRIQYRIFNYDHRYNENDYLAYIQTCKYGIILDAHESQGFAIQEALSCNVPLLVWSTRTMGQEWNGYSYSYSGIEGTTAMVSVPYWNSKCGEVFYDESELVPTYEKFIKNLDQNIYNPREFILEALSTPICAMRFMALSGIYPITESPDHRIT